MNKCAGLFLLAVVVQVLILVAVPARKIRALLTGRDVVLRTVPVDPYDVMSGYYVVLDYEISNLRNLYAQEYGLLEKNDTVYVVLKEGEEGIWRAESFHRLRPESVPDGSLVIKGRYKHGRIKYGIEAYFIPETMRKQIADDLREVEGRGLVHVKIDSSGTAAITRFVVKDKVYQY